MTKLQVGSEGDIRLVVSTVAELEHVWPWWVFGISMGVAILFLFGIFEKNFGTVLF